MCRPLANFVGIKSMQLFFCSALEKQGSLYYVISQTRGPYLLHLCDNIIDFYVKMLLTSFWWCTVAIMTIRKNKIFGDRDFLPIFDLMLESERSVNVVKDLFLLQKISSVTLNLCVLQHSCEWWNTHARTIIVRISISVQDCPHFILVIVAISCVTM